MVKGWLEWGARLDLLPLLHLSEEEEGGGFGQGHSPLERRRAVPGTVQVALLALAWEWALKTDYPFCPG